jgi:uncharacterized protein YkwD
VIRFSCPGCKRVLSGRDEQAGQAVTCPKCSQRMQIPRPEQAARERIVHPSRRPRIAGSALFGVLLLLCAGGGIGLWTHFFNHEPETVKSDTKISSRKPAGEALVPPKKTSQTPISAEKKPLPPPPVQEKREIALADDLPPELSFDLVDAINAHRAKAGVQPIFLDAGLSRICQSRAEDLARHAAPLPSPSSRTKRENEGRGVVAASDPLTAIAEWLKEPKQHAAMLEPRLRTLGAGFARNVDGEWVSVFDWTHGLDRAPPLETAPVTGAIVYPAPGQVRVPLWFPGNETPDPLPQTKDKLAGYPITLIFPPRTRVQDAAAHLNNKEENDIPLWLSAPGKPANPQYAGSQQNTICLIAKKPLRPNTRYHVEVSATVNGAEWSAKWGFTTISEGEIHQNIAGAFLRTLNRLRRRAGLPSVPLNAERSQACASHARYLSRNVPGNPALNWSDEKTGLPGYTAEGAAVARTASIQGGGGPIEAVAGLIDSLISRPQLLDPRLSEVGLGYAPFIQGGWIWVIDLHRAAREEDGKEYFYPAPNQENVPLVYPPNEAPSPIPASQRRAAERTDVSSHSERGNEAGYAITVLFDPQARVTAARANLVDDKGNEVDGWLSTPEKPAIAGFSQHSLCFLPKAPLRPSMRYTATFRAEVNGRPWRRSWSFATLKQTDRYSDDLDATIVAQLNAVRKTAGLPPVRLDGELSRGCQSHARYLALNHQHPAVLGMGVHGQDAKLPGASPEGARAAKESVIAIVLDPQTCIENWTATLYHRIPILAPDLERVGFGHARIQGHKWVCVLDTGNGRTPRDR